MNLYKKSLILFALTLMGSSLFAQIGYINSLEVMKSIPGYADSMKLVEQKQASLQAQYNQLFTDLQRRNTEYMRQKDSLPPAIANIKAQEINFMQAKLDTFTAYANYFIQSYKDKMIKGFADRIDNELKAFAAAKKLKAVYDINLARQNGLLWIAEGTDMTEEFKQRFLPAAAAPKK